MSSPRKYRVKTPEELISSGFVRTPGGEYIHPVAPPITQEKLDRASTFDDVLIAIFFAGPLDRMSHTIDGDLYNTLHFVHEPVLKVVR